MAIELTRIDEFAVLTLNRPDALNALNTALLNELADALEAWDRCNEVRCMIVTGSERAFAKPIFWATNSNAKSALEPEDSSLR